MIDSTSVRITYTRAVPPLSGKSRPTLAMTAAISLGARSIWVLGLSRMNPSKLWLTPWGSSPI